MNSTGSSSRIAALSSPLASAALEGMITLSPGTALYHASKLCECCAPLGPPAPHIVRMTRGREAPEKYLNFAAWLTIWSMAIIAKSKNMISTIGRSPTAPAPTPSPTRTASLIGVSRTRSSPNRSRSPRVTP